jgi:hypothetical protein
MVTEGGDGCHVHNYFDENPSILLWATNKHPQDEPANFRDMFINFQYI